MSIDVSLLFLPWGHSVTLLLSLERERSAFLWSVPAQMQMRLVLIKAQKKKKHSTETVSSVLTLQLYRRANNKALTCLLSHLTCDALWLLLEIIDLVLMHSYVLFFLAHVFLLSQLGPRCELGPLGSEGSSGLDKQNLHSSTANTNKAKLVTRALLPRVSVRAEGLTCCLDNSGRNAKCHLC